MNLIKNPEKNFDLTKSIENFSKNLKCNIPDVYHGIGLASGEFIISLYEELGKILETLINNNSYFSDPTVLIFLRTQLPQFIEILMRRKTCKEHSKSFFSLLCLLIRLLAMKESLDLTELCELRNVIFTIGGTPVFFNAQDIHIGSDGSQIPAQYPIGPGFFSEHGKPSVVYKSGKCLYFWEDEWQNEIGSENALGHYIATYSGNGIWREGKIINYHPSSGCHSIRYEPQINRESSEDTTGSTSKKKNISKHHNEAHNDNLLADVEKVQINAVLHEWTDLSHRERMGADSRIPCTDPKDTNKLSYSQADVGKFIRIWWSRYHKHFYGRIVAFDVRNLQHNIIYEDGDTKFYDMSTKEYDIIIPPDNLPIHNIRSQAEVSTIVANWHQKYLLSISNTNTKENTLKNNDINDPHKINNNIIAIRPPASSGYGISSYYIDLINVYYQSGGFSNMFAILCTSTPPSCHDIILHLRLIYLIRQRITATFFKTLVWEVKEGISAALNNYNDKQFKSLTRVNIQDMLYMLKELVITATNNRSNINESLELLSLTIASRLLRCSQLQKRYLGLSMIKEALEFTLPSVHTHLPPKNTSIRSLSQNIPANNNKPSQRVYTMTLVELGKWLVDHQIVEAIFGESLHQDLAARSDVILVFMAIRRVLKESHIEAIWYCTRGGHEAVVRVLHHIILLLIPVIEPSLRVRLFGLISSVPFQDYSEQTLLLLKSFSIKALKSEDAIDAFSRPMTTVTRNSGGNLPLTQKLTLASFDEKLAITRRQIPNNTPNFSPQKPWLGLAVLWQFLQDQDISNLSDGIENVSIDDNKIDLAIQLMVELLNEEFKDDREEIMQRCIENIQAGVSVPVSLQILRKILACYPAPAKGWFGVSRVTAKTPTVGSVVERLQKQSKLLDIYFVDLAKYKAAFCDQILISDLNFGGTATTSLTTTTNTTNMMSMSLGAPGNNTMNNTTILRRTRSMDNVDNKVSLNDKRIRVQGKVMRTPHLKGIKERLVFLSYLLSKSSLSLDESQTMLLWTTLGEDAATVQTLDAVVDWLDAQISSEGKQFATFLSMLVQESDLSDPFSLSKLAFLSPKSNHNNTANAVNSESESSNSFEDGVLQKLFEDKICPWALKHENLTYLSRSSVAALCLKLFLLVNINNKSIKVDVDGTWCRVGDLVGLPLIWLLAVEVENPVISDAATSLLVELHHRIGTKVKGVDNIRGYFLKQCFKQLTVSIQTLREVDVHHASGQNILESFSNTPRNDDIRNEKRRSEMTTPINPLALSVIPINTVTTTVESQSLPVANGGSSVSGINHGQDYLESEEERRLRLDKEGDPMLIARRVARYVMLMRLFVQRFSQKPIQLINVQVLAARDESVAVKFTLRVTDTVGSLRDKVAGHFHEPPETISLVRRYTTTSGTVTTETMDKMDITLQQSKLKHSDSVVARKIENAANGLKGSTSNANLSDKTSPTTPVLPDLITPVDLATELSVQIHPFDWWSERKTSGKSTSASDDWKGSSNMRRSSSENIGTNNSSGQNDKDSLFTLPIFPLNTPYGMVLASPAPKRGGMMVSSSSANSNQLVSNGSGGTESENLPLAEYLGPYLKQRPENFDQLFEMLDGYLSVEVQGMVGVGLDISAAVWDVIQSLPAHADMLKQLSDLPYQEENIKGGGAAVAPKSYPFRKLLDAGSPYRLLYCLQIINAFMPQGDKTMMISASFSHMRQDWSWRFMQLGGVDHLLEVLKSLMNPNEGGSVLDQYNSTTLHSTFNSSFGFTETSRNDNMDADTGGVTRADAYVLTIALLFRILHKFFTLDPLYNLWQASSISGVSSENEIKSTPHSKPSTTSASSSIPSAPTHSFPSGILLSVIDITTFVHEILSCIFTITNYQTTGLIKQTTMQTLVEHALLLVLGLLVSSEKGVDILIGYKELRKWLRAICLRNPIQTVRLGACRRFLEACGLIVAHCSESSALLLEEMQPRIRLFHFLFHSLLVSAHPDYARNVHNASDTGNGNGNGNGNGVATDGNSSGHAYRDSNYSSRVSSANSKYSTRCTPELYPFSEQLYSLLAGLLALRTHPEICGLRKFGIQSASQIKDLNTRNIASEYWVDAWDLCHAFIEKLVNHKSTETFHSSIPDGTLVGILRILSVLAHGNVEQRLHMGTINPTRGNNGTSSGGENMTKYSNLVAFLYLRCLFPEDNLETISTKSMNLSELGEPDVIGGALCQTWESRALAYELLTTLCDNESNLSKLIEVMRDDLHQDECLSTGLLRSGLPSKNKGQSRATLHPVTQWMYDPRQLLKEEGAHVGLINQGATCYMNAFLQQLNHVPAFAKGLLEIENTSDSTNQDIDTINDDNEKLLFQLQVLFGYLHLSQKRCHDTLAFCQTFKDYDGQSVSLSEQKDINEFASMLFEKLENNKQCQSLLSKTFGGKLVWQIISTETEYTSEREEPFYMITAEVKDKATLEDSLDLFVAGEMLTGDNKIEDSDAHKKVDALRRCAIRTLPETLIIHFKRFEFDLETLNRKKLNDRITFPMELNMFPYTEEGVAAKEAKLRSYEYDDGLFTETTNEIEKNDKIDISEVWTEEEEEEEEEQNKDDHVSDEDATDFKSSGEGKDAIGENNNVTATSIENNNKKNPKKVNHHPASYYQYTLSGIVAHVGAIDSGHYYSFIKDRVTGTWSEFNDRTVVPFNAEAIPRECFGGVDSIPGESAHNTSLRQNNAYLLFYDRKHQESSSSMMTSTAGSFTTSTALLTSFSNDTSKAMMSTPSSLPPSTQSQAQIRTIGLSPRVVSAWSDATPSKVTKAANEISTVYSIDYLDSDTMMDTQNQNDQQQQPTFSRSICDRKNSITFDSPSSADRSGEGGLSINTISKRVLQAVWSENVVFLKDRNLFHPIHFRFMWTLHLIPALSDLIARGGGSMVEIDPNKENRDMEISSTLELTNEHRANVLAKLALIIMKFDIEVLCRARALSCVQMFFDKLEEMLILDNTAVIANSIITELGRDPISLSTSNSTSILGNNSSTSSKSKDQGTDQLDSIYSKERSLLEESCHPWYLHMFILCPHPSVSERFARLILTCIKRIKLVNADHYLDEIYNWKSSPVTAIEKNRRRTTSTTSTGSSSSTSPIKIKENNINEQKINDTTTTRSPKTKENEIKSNLRGIPKLLHKLMILLENMRSEEIVGWKDKEGYRAVSGILLEFTSLGYQERALLVQLHAVSRLGLSIIALHPNISKLPNEILQSTTKLVSLLIRSAIVPPPNDNKQINSIKTFSPFLYDLETISSSSSSSSTTDGGGGAVELVQLQPDDLSTFLNRIYLEDAISISPKETSLALQHVCWSRLGREAAKILEFLGEKVIDHVGATQSLGPSQTFFNYRPYFQVIKEMVLSGAIEMNIAFEGVLVTLCRKAEQLAIRQWKGDAEYIYEVLKLLMRIGCMNVVGHNCVMRSRELWTPIRNKMRSGGGYR